MKVDSADLTMDLTCLQTDCRMKITFLSFYLLSVKFHLD